MIQPHKPLSFVIYARKSSEGEDRQLLSIPSQIQQLEDYAKREGLKVSMTLTDSASAHKINNRPSFLRLLEAIQKGEIQGILTWKADRLARNMIEGGQLIYLLQTGTIQMICTPFSRFLPTDNTLPLTIEFGMANQYSKDLSDNVSRGMRTKASQGGFCFMAPMGYRNNRLKKTVERDPVYFTKIRQLWDWYLSGNYSLMEICQSANKRGFLTPKRGKVGNCKLRRSSLQQIFTNPFYAGLIKSDDTYIKGKHKPMVSLSDFAK